MSYNTPVRHLQMGSVLQVGPSGTISIQSGGSLIIDSGASVANNGLQSAPLLTLGGTTAKWAFGTVGVASGIGTIGVPGFTRILSANANPVLGENQSNGSAVFVMVDLSLSGAGSVIFRLGSVGGALWNANGTVAWMGFGT